MLIRIIKAKIVCPHLVSLGWFGKRWNALNPFIKAMLLHVTSSLPNLNHLVILFDEKFQHLFL